MISFPPSISPFPFSPFFLFSPPFLLSSPILPPSFSTFLCSLFLPPLIPSFPSHSPSIFHCLSLLLSSSVSLSFSLLLPSHSSPSFVSPPNFLPFLHPLPPFSPSFPPLSLNSYLPSHYPFFLFHRRTYKPSFSQPVTSSIGSVALNARV